MAALLNQMPVPDMADSIWAAIDAELDVVESGEISKSDSDEKVDSPKANDLSGQQETGDGNGPLMNIEISTKPESTPEAQLPIKSAGFESENAAGTASIGGQSAPTTSETERSSGLARVFGRISTGGWISLASAAAAAVAGSVLFAVYTRPVTTLPMAPSGRAAEKNVAAPTPDSFIISPDIIFTLPPAQMPVQIPPAQAPTHSQPDSIIIAPMQVDSTETQQETDIPEPVQPAAVTPAAPAQPPVKKAKGIKGISEDDYRIGVKKDSTTKSE